MLTLKFSGNLSKLEAPFQSDYYRVSLLPIRISLVLGMLFYAAFGILDAVLMPEQKYTIWFIRFVIVCPALVGTLLASFLKSFERYMQPLLASVFILAGGGIIYIIVLAPSPVNYFHNAGLLLVFYGVTPSSASCSPGHHLPDGRSWYCTKSRPSGSILRPIPFCSITAFFSSAPTSLECWPVIPLNTMPGVIFF